MALDVRRHPRCLYPPESCRHPHSGLVAVNQVLGMRERRMSTDIWGSCSTKASAMAGTRRCDVRVDKEEMIAVQALHQRAAQNGADNGHTQSHHGEAQ